MLVMLLSAQMLVIENKQLIEVEGIGSADGFADRPSPGARR
jgi:hypothetical protein